MKILIISPVPTHPSNSGNAGRILCLSEVLKKLNHDAWFYHINFQTGDPISMENYWGNRFIDAGYQKPWKKYKWKGIPIPDRFSHSLVNKGWLDQTVDQFFDDNTLEKLQMLQEQESFDAVMVEYVFFSKALDAFPDKVLKIIDTHDVYTNRHKKLIEKGIRPEWFYTNLKEETEGLKRADVIVGIQEKETAFFKKNLPNNKNVITVGHLFDIPYNDNIEPFSDPLRFGMLGSHNSLNVQAYNWFIEKVIPQLPKDFKLQLIGNICKVVDDHPNVNKVGIVDQISDAYQKADVYINPMQWGTGLKIKSIEALSYGRLFLSTTCGLEGIESAISEDCLLANNQEEWAHIILSLLKRSDLKNNISQKNHSFACNYLKNNMVNLEKVFKKPLNKYD